MNEAALAAHLLFYHSCTCMQSRQAACASCSSGCLSSLPEQCFSVQLSISGKDIPCQHYRCSSPPVNNLISPPGYQVTVHGLSQTYNISESAHYSVCLACLRMAQEEAHSRRTAADQHAASMARGQAAAQRNQLHSNAQRTEAQLAAVQHAQRAQQIKALKADRPAPLGRR